MIMTIETEIAMRVKVAAAPTTITITLEIFSFCSSPDPLTSTVHNHGILILYYYTGVQPSVVRGMVLVSWVTLFTEASSSP